MSSPMLMENQRHIFGPPQRRGPQDRSRLPCAPCHSWRVPSTVSVPVQRPACSRCPLPTVPAAAAASADFGPPLGCPSVPMAGVTASKRTSRATGTGRVAVSPAHARARLHLALHGQAPRLQRLEHLVAHRADLEHGVDHLPLLLDPAVLAQLAVGQPERQADVHRPLVGPDADPAEQPRVRPRVVGVEVVRLAPGAVAFDGVGQVVAGIEDRHGYTIVCPALTFNASPVTPRAPSESSQQMAPRSPRRSAGGRAGSRGRCRRPGPRGRPSGSRTWRRG